MPATNGTTNGGQCRSLHSLSLSILARAATDASCAPAVPIAASKPKASWPTIASIESFVPSAKGSGGDYVSLGWLSGHADDPS
jgi:hypothetical protein